MLHLLLRPFFFLQNAPKSPARHLHWHQTCPHTWSARLQKGLCQAFEAPAAAKETPSYWDPSIDGATSCGLKESVPGLFRRVKAHRNHLRRNHQKGFALSLRIRAAGKELRGEPQHENFVAFPCKIWLACFFQRTKYGRTQLALPDHCSLLSSSPIPETQRKQQDQDHTN